MIPLTAIFEIIRKNKKYRKGPLSLALGLTSAQVNKIILWEMLPNELVVPWAAFLDIHMPDYAPLHQYNERHRLYKTMLDISQNNQAADIAAIIILLKDKLNLDKLRADTLSQAMQYLYVYPPEIQNAIAEYNRPT